MSSVLTFRTAGGGRKGGGAHGAYVYREAEGPHEGHTGIGHLRKPLVQVSVLYASDARVVAYARSMCDKLMSVGCDVFLNVRAARRRLR